MIFLSLWERIKVRGMKRKNVPFSRRLRRHQTNAEKILWYKIRNRQVKEIKFRRQYAIGNFIVDFISIEKKLIVELDGGDHNKEINKIYDKKRTEYLESFGYTVIRFWNSEVFNNIEEVLDTILCNLNNPHPNLLPNGEGD